MISCMDESSLAFKSNFNSDSKYVLEKTSRKDLCGSEINMETSQEDQR